MNVTNDTRVDASMSLWMCASIALLIGYLKSGTLKQLGLASITAGLAHRGQATGDSVDSLIIVGGVLLWGDRCGRTNDSAAAASRRARRCNACCGTDLVYHRYLTLIH